MPEIATPDTTPPAAAARTPNRKNATVFYSRETEIHAIEIIVGTKHGETIKPDFMADGRLRYRVPNALVERFSRHSHVTSGRVRKAR